jgi:RNA polymerase sigma factor (sigma-70 family)
MPSASSHGGDHDSATHDLLHRLNSADGGPAWAEFLDLYAPLIIKVANQFDYERDAVSDCFVYVCERLVDDGFRRLLKFNTRGKASFSTWLSAVVFNLCVDWHRREFGRARMLPAISALSIFDQALYRFRFEQGMDREACFQTMLDDVPDLTREQFSEALARITRLLTPRQRWQFAVRMGRKFLNGGGDGAHQISLSGLPDGADDPEAAAHRDQEQAFVQQALAALSRRQRFLLNLRFHQGLTYEAIGRMSGLGDLFKARKAVQTALVALSDELASLSERVGNK